MFVGDSMHSFLVVICERQFQLVSHQHILQAWDFNHQAASHLAGAIQAVFHFETPIMNPPLR